MTHPAERSLRRMVMYQTKMALLVFGHATTLALLVWFFH